MNIVQVAVFLGLMLVLAVLTWRKVAAARAASHASADREIFLAGGGLSWFFVAGAITLTNLSTDQLVGMNGNQMLLLAWWELAGFVGLLLLAFVFVPIYYRNNCTTITQLLEQRYDGASIRTVISALFLLGNLLIYLPAVIYSGALFMQTLFGVDASVTAIAALFAIVGAAYAILGGLRAVAVLDTYAGVGILALALVVVFLAMQAVGWDISTDVPRERLTMIGSLDSPIPFHTLFTGMLFIQIFYWSTNQNITQKALAAPSVKEAQKGVIAAAIIRVLIVPPIVVVPGIVAFKLFGDVDDRAYAMVVGEVLPGWTSGMFAAMIAAAVLTTYAAVMNATITLWSVDFHRRFINPDVDVRRLNRVVGIVAMIGSIALVPLYAGAESIINLLQELNGLLSMPILSAFIAALLFRNMDARAAVAGLLWGFSVYALHTFYLYVPANFGGVSWYATIGLPWVHYIDVMVFVLFSSVLVALLTNLVVFGNRARLAIGGASPPDPASI
ncbi:sodium/solute symporter [Erythrobacter sp. JK5]|uniref:sodium:solute symporter family transporter n=1 Tax=Erythrobacter sp. JK5 TaxID=2829500 RepID=UPI001BA79E48|nr:sodium/solute symporter [Erythrobacter sp. JK5]QUL38113.1 sodium/solute symporter [Erythrobacter sp. JK5]